MESRISNNFINSLELEDANQEGLLLEGDSSGPFKYCTKKQLELTTVRSSVREKYEYQSIAPYKGPSKLATVNRNETRTSNIANNQLKRFLPGTKPKVQNFAGKYQRAASFDSHSQLSVNRKQTWNKDDLVDQQSEASAKMITSTTVKNVENFQQQVQNYGLTTNARRTEGKKYAVSAGIDEMNETNPKQLREDCRADLQMGKEVISSKIPSVRAVHYKPEMMKSVTSTNKRTRNVSPSYSFEPRPPKVTSIVMKPRDSAHEKEHCWYTPLDAETGQLKNDAKSKMNLRQSAKDDHLSLKPKQHARKHSSSEENLKLKEALEKSKIAVNRLEDELRQCENQLKQVMQSKQNLQKQITELDKEKQMCITDFHQYYRRANIILKMQSQLDERIELLAGFLNNESKLKETIAVCVSTSYWTKLQETLKFYEKSFEEMEAMKLTCYNSYKMLCKSVEETSIDELEKSNLQQLGLDVSKHIASCKDKRIQMQTQYDRMQADILELKAEIDNLVNSADCKRDQLRTKFISLSQRIKFEIGLLRKEKNDMKDQAIKEIANHRNIITSSVNEIDDVKAEIERLSAENHNIQENTDALMSKKVEVDNELTFVECELNDLMAKLSASRDQIKSKKDQNMSLIKIKSEELDEMKYEMSTLETKKNDLIKKLEDLRCINESKNKLLQLQTNLGENAQTKKTLEEVIATLKKEQREKELQIGIVEEKVKSLKERKQELLQQMRNLNDSHMQERKAQISILETVSCVKGHQNSSHEAKQRELSSALDDIIEILNSIVDLELQRDLISKDNVALDAANRMKKKDLIKILYEKQGIEGKIRMLRKFVKEKHYTTVQEINKNINEVIKKKTAEESIVDALVEDIKKQKLKLEDVGMLKKTAEKKRKLDNE